jgi:general secretion pathway protein E
MSDGGNHFALDARSLRGVSVEQGVIRLIEHVSQIRGSDIYLSMDRNDAGIAIRYQGIYQHLCRVNHDEGLRFMSHIRAMSGMPFAQKQVPSDGRWICVLSNGRTVDLRINTIPTLWGDDMTIRLLECDAGLAHLSELGYPAQGLERLRTLLNSGGGLILVTGPTGAGKTTTLYACLDYLNDGNRKINTIEDPIEYEMHGIRQSQVRTEHDLDFPVLLRSVLRQAPDVIMIGEVRDKVTAETAVRAANSGHLVLATLHSPFAANAVNTMLALGVNNRFLATSLLGSISQRLVRKLCPHCKIPRDLSTSPYTFDEIRAWLEPGQPQHIYAAKGCKECFFEGYQGRGAMAEVLCVNADIRDLIHEKAAASEIRKKAVELGMLDLRSACLLALAQGITSVHELMRTTRSILPASTS